MLTIRRDAASFRVGALAQHRLADDHSLRALARHSGRDSVAVERLEALGQDGEEEQAVHDDHQ